jgi:hypothetical protein
MAELKEPRNKELVLKAFDTLFNNKRDYVAVAPLVAELHSTQCAYPSGPRGTLWTG